MRPVIPTGAGIKNRHLCYISLAEVCPQPPVTLPDKFGHSSRSYSWINTALSSQHRSSVSSEAQCSPLMRFSPSVAPTQKGVSKAKGEYVDDQDKVLTSVYALQLLFARRSALSARIGFGLMTAGFLLDLISKW